MDFESFLQLGRTRPENPHEPFVMTPLGIKMSRSANGVSRRHGEVARQMWQSLFPERPVDTVPIGHVTNGVHLPTWMAPATRALLDRHLEDGWMTRAADPADLGSGRRTSPTRSCGPCAAGCAASSSSTCGTAASPPGWHGARTARWWPPPSAGSAPTR